MNDFEHETEEGVPGEEPGEDVEVPGDEVEAAEVPAESEDTEQDTAEDTEQDTAEDTEQDTAEDTEQDTAEDTERGGDEEGGFGDELAEPASPEEVAEVAKEFVDGLLAAMELEAEVTTSIEDETAFVDVAGENLGGLIGRRGQTLDALQELVRTAVQRRLRSRVRLLVDVEGYRARRRASLVEYAKEMAERAMERGTEIELEPMSAYERKIVHQAVSEIDGASSFSEGEEPARKVVIRGE